MQKTWNPTLHGALDVDDAHGQIDAMQCTMFGLWNPTLREILDLDDVGRLMPCNAPMFGHRWNPTLHETLKLDDVRGQIDAMQCAHVWAQMESHTS